MSKKKKIILIVAVVLLAVIAAMIALGVYANTQYKKIKKTEIKEEEISVNEELQEEVEEPGFLNVAFFGIDTIGYGSKDAESDAIVIASLDRKSKEVKYFSVSANEVLADKDGGLITASDIYAEGPQSAVEILNRNLDMDIERYVTVDFMALVGLVDAVEGIEIDVTKEEVPHIQGYADGIAQMVGKEGGTIEKEGVQVLNGIQAAAYCRIRATEGGDAVRTKRQQEVLARTMDKLGKIEVTKIDAVIDELFPKIETNFELAEIVTYAKDVGAYKMKTLEGFPRKGVEVGGAPKMDSKTGLPEVPEVMPENYLEEIRTLHKELFPELPYEPSEGVQKAAEVLK